MVETVMINDRPGNRELVSAARRLTYIFGLGNFGTDIKRYAYVLKDDESGVPKGLKRAEDIIIIR